MSGRGVAASVATVVVLGALAGAAQAEPGLANKVYDPYVRNGVTEFETRAGRLNRGELASESAAVVEVEHGFGDRLSLGLVAEFEHHAGEESKLDSVGLESIVYLGQIPKLGVDVGGYLEYEQRIHAESGVLEGKLLLARQFGPVRTLVNLIADRALTDKPGEDVTAFGYAAEATVEALPRLQAGVQAFGDLGTNHSFGGLQSHYIGPVVNWEFHPQGLPGELELETAYLLPAGAARHETDSQVRVMLAYERRF
jgi:hypothetical protein